jgi:hypothetical protein
MIDAIRSGDPVIGKISVPGSYHSVLIYGAYIVEGRTYWQVFDPIEGHQTQSTQDLFSVLRATAILR